MLYMNTDCKDCIHKNVCKKHGEIDRLWKDLQLSTEAQKLENNGISLDASCIDFTNEAMHVYTKIIKEE